MRGWIKAIAAAGALVAAGAVVLAILARDWVGPQGARLVASPTVVGVDTGGSYAWVLTTSAGPVLIDAGIDPAATAIVAELAERGFSRRDVRTILLTHVHPDHIGGLDVFDAATVYVHADDAGAFAGAPPAFATIPSLLAGDGPGKLATPPVVVEDGAVVPLGDVRATVTHLPGHTPGSVAWTIGDVLFSGDALIGTRTGVAPAPALFATDAAQGRASIARLQGARPAVMCDGHIGVTPSPGDAIEAFLQARR